MAVTASASPLRRMMAQDWEGGDPAGIRHIAKYARRTGRSGHRSRRVYHVLKCDPGQSSGKRLFDILGATLALLFLAPLFIGVAVIIKATSPGPVFFRQSRYGYGNRLFKIYKFRTMDDRLGDVTGVRQTTDDDPRVTPIGRVLRQTSLDELPQLINVLRGHMSLVGPRPHVPEMHAAGRLYEDLVPYYFQRHAVRPGITGLAQVSGCRGSTVKAGGAIARIHYDLEYIEKWSLWMDVKVIARTVQREFLSGNGF